MKKACHILFISFYLQAVLNIWCQANVNVYGELDSIRLKRCMEAVNEINAAPLTKAYLVRNTDKSWTLHSHNTK
jgi:hypothetical protein